jgi:hypothetical protein
MLGAEMSTHPAESNGPWREAMSNGLAGRARVDSNGQPLMVAIRVHGTVVARDGGEDDPTGLQHASNSLYRLTNGIHDTPDIYTVGYGAKVQDPDTGEMRHINEYHFPILDVYLDNEDELLEKALETWHKDGEDVQVDVLRNEDGEFAERSVKRDPKEAMARRQARLKHRRARRDSRETLSREREAAEQAQEEAQPATLKDLASRLINRVQGQEVAQQKGREVRQRPGRVVERKEQTNLQLFKRPEDMHAHEKGISSSDHVDERAEDRFVEMSLLKGIRFSENEIPLLTGKNLEELMEPGWHEAAMDSPLAYAQGKRDMFVDLLDDYATHGDHSYVETRRYETALEASRAARSLNTADNGRDEGRKETYAAYEPSALDRDVSWVVRTTAYRDAPVIMVGEDSEYGDANEAVDWAMSGLTGVEFKAELMSMREVEQMYGLANPDYDSNIQLSETNPMVVVMRVRFNDNPSDGDY